MRGALACALVGLGVALPGSAEPPEWLRFAPEASIPDVVRDALAIAPERQEELWAADASYTDLLWRAELELSDDGLVRERVVHVRRYLSEQGLESGGALEFTAKPSHEEVVITAAFTLDEGGRRVPVERDTVQRLDYVQPRIFSDVHRIVVPLPGLRVGATGVLVYEKSYASDEWPLPWSALLISQVMNPVERFEAVVRWDAAQGGVAWKTDDPALDCEELPGELRCRKLRAAALPMDADFGAIYDSLPQLVLERSGSWNALAQSARALVDGQLRSGVPASVVETLTAEARSADERWEALYRFVAEEIRYLGLEHRIDSVVPRPPRVTLERRYGDCKDKVTLLLALAEAAGLDAHAALVAIGRKDASGLLLPAATYFDHMIACRRDDAGRLHCADPTVRAASTAESLLAIAGNAALDLDGSSTAPRSLPRPEYAWDIEVEGETSLHCDGRVEGRQTRRLAGMAAQAYRAGLAPLAPLERRNALEQEFAQAAGGLAAEVEVEAIDDPSRPVVATARFDVLGSGPLARHDSFGEGSLWLRFHGLSLRTDNRFHAFRNPGLRVRSTQRYALCPEVRARFSGPVLDLVSPFGSLRRSYTIDDDGVEVASELLVRSRDVPALEIPRFNGFLEAAMDQTDVWFSLHPAR